MRERSGRERLDRLDPIRRHDQHFTGLDVAFVRRADEIHRARLRTHDDRVAEAAEGERAESVRIADRDHPVPRQHHQRKRALHLSDRFDDRILDLARLRTRIEMKNDLRVAIRLEDRALPHEIVAQLTRVHDVAVVTKSDLPVRAINQDRLRIQQLALSGRRVAHVTDRHWPRQRRQRLAVEDIRDVAHGARDAHLRSVRGRDAGALLAAMLQRVQPQVRHVGGFGMSEDAEDTTLVFEFIQHVQATRFTKYCSMAFDHTRSASSTA